MMKKKRGGRSFGAIITGLIGLLAVTMLISVVLGRYPITIRQSFDIIADHLLSGLGITADSSASWTKTQASLLLNHRLPRILMACLVGCCLSTAGATYQGVFRNPMAAPDILGASSGAAFGAALGILWGLDGWRTILLAFFTSLVTVGLVIFMGNRMRGKRILGIILAGIMISSLASSGTSFVKLVADPNDQLPAITYWLMGSLNGTNPAEVTFVLLPMLIGLAPIFILRWRINMLTLGDDECRTIGINAGRLRLIMIISATLMTAASVSVSGMIGWIGLVIPHFARRIVGDDYRRLIPVSMLFGAIFLLIVDDFSRNLATTEIPIGILTSMIGVPFFLYLISKDGDKL